ncbi:sensor histidine kinase [Streptomyces millisiae]|uniref:histidine kinase n=1 Tax=Streptomyces millisiae TaxID=3075542 RepID=A0ABU2LWN7_9ACTN|nr:histidine kinase [Streptomyces sp. DSM 44918]MDT0321597.1 histidine kinase [Streptomyces sp. DSM 44918]
MVRRLIALAAVSLADTALLAAVLRDRGSSPWPLAGYAVAALTVAALCRRRPLAGFAAAQCAASLTGAGQALLLWSSYLAGRALRGRADAAVVAGAVLGGLAVQLLAVPVRTDALSRLVSGQLIFVALPLLLGRYLAQHHRLLRALDERNRRLLREREFLAERERLRERLRIARDMHDSLGHRLSLVSVQAAALEVAELPPAQRATTRQLAEAARGALTELHDLVGALRGTDAGPRPPEHGLAGIRSLVAGCRAAGVPVTLRERGAELPLGAAGWGAAHRVVEEGLTNAARHAPGRPVTVALDWESDALLLTVVNPLAAPAAPPAPSGGHGLAGLAERVGAAGGFLDHRHGEDGFRLVAMVPAEAAEAAETPDPGAGGVARGLALGTVTAVVLLAVPAAGMLVGVR